jgi:hypothetical protein
VAKKNTSLIPIARIERAIMVIRDERVMLSTDLADLYGVTTKQLNQAVKRNLDRFPTDFMFQLTKQESDEVRTLLAKQQGEKSQLVIPKRGENIKYLPYAFTEQGVAMLSSVLRSPRAVAVNIEVMRAFVRLRQWAVSNAELARRIDELEQKYDGQFVQIFDALRQLMSPPAAKPREMGYHTLVSLPGEKLRKSQRRA